ncbi:hypothetical protein BD324DRAFT_607033 [Kockovaella imperatae]|uniref:Glycosyltransferase 2-like domain-containing protein n=1 Tax=Kockovaella imperatae TaxID=4999 RepID=A0A1Y1UP48_9TREE|nr:hypothetical protein BD324DRAFT_607033 [Kockovaella imperatae]ORX39820.1 hypothetical protein BD324DRAFT_607033 [Kockovaella imperatae]
MLAMRRSRTRSLQRVPFISHVLFVALLVFGPNHCPTFLAGALLALHAVFMGINLRSVYGAFSAWRGVKIQSSIDWHSKYLDDVRDNETALAFEDVSHLIIIPTYCESIEILRETLYLLSTHRLAAATYHPVLAFEARETGAVSKALALVQEFSHRFACIGYTIHPADTPGEARGKSSNLAWSIRQAWQEMESSPVLKGKIDKVVVTCMDSDTALAGDYFEAISCKYALRPEQERPLVYYIPPIAFDRNAHEVPSAVRLTDTMWSIAGTSAIFPESTTKIPTSAYSLSLSLLANVGFHDTGPEAIGEDMHMYIKCLFATGGRLLPETIYSPASQLDVVSSHVVGWRGYWNAHVARYQQALRHMWGSLDSLYAARMLMTGDFVAHRLEPSFVTQNTVFTYDSFDNLAPHRLGRRLSLLLPMETVEEVDGESDSEDLSDSTPDLSDSSPESRPTMASSATSLFELASPLIETKPQAEVPEETSTRWLPFMSLALRLYEAHFLMGHIALLVVHRALFPVPENLHPFLQWSVNITDRYRGISPIFLLIGLFLYELYINETVTGRWKRAGDRLGIQSTDQRSKRMLRSLLDVAFVPIATVLAVVPLFHAQFLHLFTERLEYRVSLKPIREAIEMV